VADEAALARQLAEIAAAGQDQPQRIADLCVRLLGVSGAGISIVTEAGNRGMVCATDDIATRIEELQFTLGEGPCVDAVGGGGPVMVGDLRGSADLATERWPGFLAAADLAGVSAVFAFPLRVGAIVVGAIDLYRDVPGGLSDAQLGAALLAADAAAIALIHMQNGRRSTDISDGRVDGRPAYEQQIHQATGMVQVQLACSTETAFLMLRARAFADDRPVAEISSDVVNRYIRFTSEGT
jgi:hypothetical protein